MKDKIKNYLKKNMFGFILMFLFILCDQIIKLIVKNTMELGENIKFIKNFISFEYILNAGAGFGILQGKRIFLILITLIAFIIFGYLYKDVDYKKSFFYSLGLNMIISGTIGNFIDRIFNNGLVVDYIKTDFITFPIFNFADMLLTVGVILLFIHFIFFDLKKDENNCD